MSFAPGNNSANYNSCADWNGQNGNVTTVGSNGGPSAYGTFDQSGNVDEWNEAVVDSFRGLRGGYWNNTAFLLSSSRRNAGGPSGENNGIGFRLSSSSSVLNPLNLPYFVSVDDINNSNDNTNYGSVSYLYQIAQYSVTNCEYAQFLNAIASTDTYGLYNANMDTDAKGGITRNGSSGSYSYSVKANMGNKPVVYVSWFDAARYCNWLHNGKPTGLQNNTTTEDGAYTLNGARSGVSIVRNAGAKYSIPTENEWYKAAYYKGGGTNAGYWAYATQSDNAPTCVSANSIGDGPVNSNYSCEEVSVTPTITPTNSVTPSVTPTTTPTNTVTPSVTPTTTPTNSITPTNTVTPTVTPTNTTTPTVTPTNTNTPFLSPSVTPTNSTTPTTTPTRTVTSTVTPTPTKTPRPTRVRRPGDVYIKCCPIETPTPSVTSSNTPTRTITPSATPTKTPTSTSTVTPTNTPTRTITPTNTTTPTNTVTSTNITTTTPTPTPTIISNGVLTIDNENLVTINEENLSYL